MDAPPNPPAAAPGPEAGAAADAYEAFWNCVDNDGPPAGEESPPSGCSIRCTVLPRNGEGGRT